MQHSVLALPVLTIALVVTACRGQPCQSRDIDKVVEACMVEPAGSPSYSACRAANLTPPTDFDFSAHSAAACDATESGAFYACLASKSSRCISDAGTVDQEGLRSIMAECTAGGWSQSSSGTMNCSTCDAAAAACNSKCPTTSWAACADCAGQCSVSLAKCLKGCTP